MTLVIPSRHTPSSRLEARTTLEAMRRRVREELAAPLVWETARRIVASVPSRQEVEQARAIRAWCAARWHFVNDPLDTQLLTTPLYVLEEIRKRGVVMGNCADAAMLTAALNMAVHLPCRFVAVAFGSSSAPYAHVFTVAYPRNAMGARTPVEMDITRPVNQTHVTFSRRLFLEV